MRTLSLLLILFSIELLGQQQDEWIKMLENPEFPRTDTLKQENILSEYIQFDFSEIMNPKYEILGFIGSKFQRIHVDFMTITKSETIPNVYFVTGKTTVNYNTCEFEGTITIQQVRLFNSMHFGVDDFHEDAEIKSQGIIIGKYQLSENPEQLHAGIFDGIMTSWWYMNKNGEIKYDDLSIQSDRYKNNQYIGSWTEYGKYKSRICNWGEFRIPFSGDLDIGAAEFSVNSKYRNNGWEN